VDDHIEPRALAADFRSSDTKAECAATFSWLAATRYALSDGLRAWPATATASAGLHPRLTPSWTAPTR
jgi:hypothetical protein